MISEEPAQPEQADSTQGSSSPASTEEAREETRPKAQRLKKGKNWAHAALNESFLDNRINGQTWQTFGYRLVPDVKKRLEARLAADKRASGNRRLAQGHYVNVAMLHAPSTTEERLEMINEFLRERGGVTDPGRPTNYRVSGPAYEDSRDLDMEITEAAKRGLVIFFFSAVVQSLLDALDREGPLARPEILRRVQ
ncbi:hypothetical protein QFZ82_000462 [Streptomyces sp. V4I23]|uniref:hypothetical protein n=1 Tax=Streptomyces sp. V4I23 TaxID=3042282 RepID=UPI00277EAAD5|nr:hypothetical protein [Streptomyces sp. V4I23]MDQ1005977.1 hypothetical protein [Streptomyces sp. V4I23]